MKGEKRVRTLTLPVLHGNWRDKWSISFHQQVRFIAHKKARFLVFSRETLKEERGITKYRSSRGVGAARERNSGDNRVFQKNRIFSLTRNSLLRDFFKRILEEPKEKNFHIPHFANNLVEFGDIS